MDVAELIAVIGPRLAGALVATDFDGTLAPLVADPERSRPVAGTLDALTALADRGARIAVITGRDARTVVRLGGLDRVPGIVVAGLYGLETWTSGELHTPDEPPQLAQLRRRLPAVMDSGDPQLWIEDKRLSLVVHARRADDPAAALATVAGPVRGLAAELGLEAHPGSGVLELRLPGHDKAAALRRLAQGRTAVLYLGDDLGDVPAFEELGRLRENGVAAYGVAVLSSNVADALAVADVHVPDPAAAVDLLRVLGDPGTGR